MHTDKKASQRLPLIVSWQNISNINNKGESTCRNIIKELRSKHGCYYITEDHICDYFMISHEQYLRCQGRCQSSSIEQPGGKETSNG